MNVPMINCAMCANPMPANAQYCPNCGHTNAFVAPGSAVAPPTPKPNAPESGFVTPMPPPAFAADPSSSDKSAAPDAGGSTQTPSSSALGASSDTPQGGSPTINIGSPGEAARYTPPPASTPEGAWQPGQYGSAPNQGGQAPGQPPAYSPYPVQPTQAQQPYAPPPAQQYPQTQALPPYNAQQSAQPPAPFYSQTPQPQQYNYQYQQQVGVAGVPRRDPTVVLLLELLGYLGFLGIGHIYAGRTARGIALLIGWWVYLTVSAILMIVLIGFCLLLAGLVVPILSGLWIKSDVDKDNAMYRPQY